MSRLVNQADTLEEPNSISMSTNSNEQTTFQQVKRMDRKWARVKRTEVSQSNTGTKLFLQMNQSFDLQDKLMTGTRAHPT